MAGSPQEAAEDKNGQTLLMSAAVLAWLRHRHTPPAPLLKGVDRDVRTKQEERARRMGRLAMKRVGS